jgi:4-carboxymuconolactone decarboxylase
MKQLLYITLLTCGITFNGVAQDSDIFPRGEKAANVHHVGNVWLNELTPADNVFTYSTSVATFDAGARLDWHSHPGGQILLITQGVGYYQERGKAKQTVRKGDVVKCQPGVEHWHGATPESGVTYVATSPAQNGKTVWLKRVTNEEYGSVSSTTSNDASSANNQEQDVLALSKDKWTWMADKNVDKLKELFDNKSVFVHMGGSWGKQQELDVIKSGGIHYKKADVHEASVQIIGNTAIVLNRITLLAVVGGNEVTNPFIVTEVYTKENGKWKMGSLSFTKTMGQGSDQPKK